MGKLFAYKEHHFDFIGKRKICYAIALLVILAGLVMLVVSGLNVGIDFTGGSIFKVTYNEPVELSEVRSVASEFVAQTPSVNESDNNQFVIRTEELDEEQGAALLEALAQIGSMYETSTSVDRIGPTIGSELLRNARWALLIAGVLMLLYITIRFKFNYAITAIVALMHDVLVMVSLFAIFRIEVNSEFIAAILTIIGYSINNTIVIFDRIRENDKGNSKDFAGLVNTSINQTLGRTINTELAVLFLLFALIIFGGATTKAFVLALIFGMFAGFFSSVFLVGNILVFVTNIFGKGKNGSRRAVNTGKVSVAKGK